MRTHSSLALSSTTWGHSEKVPTTGREEELGMGRQHLDLGLVTSRTGRCKHLLFKPPGLQYVVIIAWADENRRLLCYRGKESSQGLLSRTLRTFHFYTWEFPFLLLQLFSLGANTLLLHWGIPGLSENLPLPHSCTVFALFGVTNCSATFTAFIRCSTCHEFTLQMYTGHQLSAGGKDEQCVYCKEFKEFIICRGWRGLHTRSPAEPCAANAVWAAGPWETPPRCFNSSNRAGPHWALVEVSSSSKLQIQQKLISILLHQSIKSKFWKRAS